MIACPGDVTDDAGVTDAGGEGEGEGEGEQPVPEAGTCNPTSSTNECDEGLICVQGQLSPTVGSCRVDCSDDETACPANRTCQDALTAELEPIGTVCLPQQTQRDGQCQAILDPDACAGDLECLVVDNNRDTGVITSTCKEVCDYYGDGSDCGSGEFCGRADFIAGFQANPADPAATVSCTVDACDRDGDTTDCECELDEGFDCFTLDQNGQPAPTCVLVPGNCAIPTPNLLPDVSNFAAATCNNVDDHRICDDRPYQELENGAEVACLGVPGMEFGGVCAAFCFQPAYDYNGNGTVSEELSLSCLEGEECTFELGLGFFEMQNDEQVECSIAECPEGEFCDECPNPAANICERETEGGEPTGRAFCVVPFGLCHPAAAPDEDAGPEPDAGETNDDAGETEIDAGVDDDAGVTEGGDAGVTEGGDAGN